MKWQPKTTFALCGTFALGLVVGLSIAMFPLLEHPAKLPQGFYELTKQQTIREFLESRGEHMQQVEDFRYSLGRPKEGADWDHESIKWTPDATIEAGDTQLRPGTYVTFSGKNEGEANQTIAFGDQYLTTDPETLSAALKIDSSDDQLPPIHEFLGGRRYTSDNSNGGFRLSFRVEDAKDWIDRARGLMISPIPGKNTGNWKSWMQLNGSNYALLVSEDPDAIPHEPSYSGHVTLQADSTNTKISIFTWNPD